MKRSEHDKIIERCITTAAQRSVALPKWVGWSPDQFGANADGVRDQGLGWKVVDFGQNKFNECGLVVLVVANAIFDQHGEPLSNTHAVNERTYPASSFSRKFLFVQAGQTEPHHFHVQKARKEVTVLSGGPVRFELAWADGDKALSDRAVSVQIDGIWHELAAHGSVLVNAGETITLAGDLSHIIEVAKDTQDAIMLETSTANNDSRDNIFPFMTPSATKVEEDAKPRYQVIGEYVAVAAR